MSMDVKFEILHESENNMSRTGSLLFKRTGRVMRIETPVLWLTCTINGNPRIWEELREVKYVMLSCYDIIKNQRNYVKNLFTRNDDSLNIHKRMGFNGYVFLDSGGFQFLRKKNLDVAPKTVLEFQNKSGADLSTIFDYPFSLYVPIEEKLKLIRKTIQSLRAYVNFSKNQSNELLFLPVIHGHDSDTLIKMAKKVKEIYNESLFCVGSLVPVLFPVKYSGIEKVARAFLDIRKMFPESFIHVLGAGSSLSFHLFFYLGADSVDSSTWITKAGFGNIHLPGQGAAYIQRDGRRKKCRFIDWKKYDCNCPICKGKAPDEILTEMDRHDSYGRKLRAIHNAWVYLKEVELVRKSIIEGEYQEMVRQRMYNTSMRKILESLIQTVNTKKLV